MTRRQTPRTVRDPTKPAPDPRIWGRHYTRPVAVGLRAADRRVLLAIGVYLAFAKKLPFTSQGYELHATFENAATLRRPRRCGSPASTSAR